MTSKSITLTPAESLFRQCIIDCIDSQKWASSKPEARITGGWVRDKLLDVQSHDIDVALSTMTGMEFVVRLQDFLSQCGNRYEEEATKLGIKAGLGSVHKVAENPEKSKHLETATTRMFGFDLDFVNLRKETYSGTSRNPQMEFGTPEEDALRRDATVNALFYNLHTQQIEDFTHKGLQDMDAKTIRTPLAPYQTFKDDPLRVLRLIRFASKLGYDIEPGSLTAMKDKSIHEALRLKISRERVRIEVDKMLTGPDPHRALMLIHDLDLYASVFANPTNEFVPELSTSNPRIYDGLAIVLHNCETINTILRTGEDTGLCWYLAAYASWMDEKSEKLMEAARKGMDVPNKTRDILGAAVQNRQLILNMIEKTQAGARGAPPRRSEIGMTIRRLGATWRAQILYSLLCDFYFDNGKAVIQRYDALLLHIRQQDLEDAPQKVGIIDGRKIRDALGGAKSGPWMKRATEMVMEWQLDNPEGTREEAAEMIKHRGAELGLG